MRRDDASTAANFAAIGEAISVTFETNVAVTDEAILTTTFEANFETIDEEILVKFAVILVNFAATGEGIEEIEASFQVTAANEERLPVTSESADGFDANCYHLTSVRYVLDEERPTQHRLRDHRIRRRR